jgi:hypothetical protein
LVSVSLGTQKTSQNLKSGTLKNLKKGARNMADEALVYDLKDLSNKLRISIRTLRKYITNGKLKAKLVGRAYFVTETNLMAFLEPDA